MRRKVTFGVCEETVEAAEARACADAKATPLPSKTANPNAATNLFIGVVEPGAQFVLSKNSVEVVGAGLSALARHDSGWLRRPVPRTAAETAHSADGTMPRPVRPRHPPAPEFPPSPIPSAPSAAIAACPRARSLPPKL